MNEAAATNSSDPNFDRIARPYALLEHLTFGKALHRARTHLLEQLAPCNHVLILGDGDGRFTAALLARYPHLRADAVDLSSAMLAQLSRRVHAADPTASARLCTHHTNALLFTPEPDLRYDLVVTHFFLDCLSEPELNQLCAQIRPHFAPGAAWLLSDFHIPANALRRPATWLVRSLYLAFRILTGLRTTRLPNYSAALRRIGLTPIARHASLGGILISELWQFPPASRE